MSFCFYCRDARATHKCGGGCGIRYCGTKCALGHWQNAEHRFTCIPIGMGVKRGRSGLNDDGEIILVIQPSKMEVRLPAKEAQEASETLKNLVEEGTSEDGGETLIIPIPGEQHGPHIWYMVRDVIIDEKGFFDTQFDNLSFSDAIRFVSLLNYLDMKSTLQKYPQIWTKLVREMNTDSINKIFSEKMSNIISNYEVSSYSQMQTEISEKERNPAPMTFYGTITLDQITTDVWQLIWPHLSQEKVLSLLRYSPRMYHVTYNMFIRTDRLPEFVKEFFKDNLPSKNDLFDLLLNNLNLYLFRSTDSPDDIDPYSTIENLCYEFKTYKSAEAIRNRIINVLMSELIEINKESANSINGYIFAQTVDFRDVAFFMRNTLRPEILDDDLKDILWFPNMISVYKVERFIFATFKSNWRKYAQILGENMFFYFCKQR